MFSIHSVSSNREIVFHSRQGDEFEFELLGFSPTARLEVSTYTDSLGLNNFFQEIGGLRNPWQGMKSWESLEGEFSISVSCTTLGNVIFYIALKGQRGGAEEWCVEAGLEVELGMLENIARKSATFFNSNS